MFHILLPLSCLKLFWSCMCSEKNVSLSSAIVCWHCLEGGELQLCSVPEVAVNSKKPLQGSCMSMSSIELRLEDSTVIRFTTPCYLNQYYRNCQSGLCSLLNSVNLIIFFPDGMHWGEMKELAKELTKPLLLIYQQSWLTGEVPLGWKLMNIMLIYKKGC